MILAPMMALLVWLGLYPQPVFNTFRPVASRIEQYADNVAQPTPSASAVRFLERDASRATSPGGRQE